MTIDGEIRDEKLQYNINREAAKRWKIDKCEYVTGKEILHPDQSRIIGYGKFNYSPLKKALEKQTKMIEDAVEMQMKTIEYAADKKNSKTLNTNWQLRSIRDIFPKTFLTTDKLINVLRKIIKISFSKV